MSVKQVLYTAHGAATGGRAGKGATDDNRVNVTLSVPKGMGGACGSGCDKVDVLESCLAQHALAARERKRCG